jgi:hypothetical protein
MFSARGSFNHGGGAGAGLLAFAHRHRRIVRRVRTLH